MSVAEILGFVLVCLDGFQLDQLSLQYFIFC